MKDVGNTTLVVYLYNDEISCIKVNIYDSWIYVYTYNFICTYMLYMNWSAVYMHLFVLKFVKIQILYFKTSIKMLLKLLIFKVSGHFLFYHSFEEL